MIKAWFIDRRGRQYYMTFASEQELEQYVQAARKRGHDLTAACRV